MAKNLPPILLFLLLSNCNAQEITNKKDFYNTTFYDIPISYFTMDDWIFTTKDTVLKTLQVHSGTYRFLSKEIDFNSDEFQSKYFAFIGEDYKKGKTKLPEWCYSDNGELINPLDFESNKFKDKYKKITGKEFIPERSELPEWCYLSIGKLNTILTIDLNSDNIDENVILFDIGYDWIEGYPYYIIYVFDNKISQHTPITYEAIYYLAENSEYCRNCKGIEVKDGKINIYKYPFDEDGGIISGFYDIKTYALKNNKLLEIKSSRYPVR